MIPLPAITAWSTTHPWPTPDQVEQDLLLARAICAIATDPYLGDELTFRGGTALHKLHLDHSYRYSEDLDYVRSTGGGVGRVLDALKDVGRALGFTVKSTLGEHPKVFWRTASEAGNPLRIKIEINTHERSPAMPVAHVRHQVASSWWDGEADIRTFQIEELIATKIRALFQRSKGRDLYDIWLALTVAEVDPERVVAAFAPYRPDGYTSARAVTNLEAKLAERNFRGDLDLLAIESGSYDIDAAAALVVGRLISLV